MRHIPRLSQRLATSLLCAVVGLLVLLAAGRAMASRGPDLLYPNLKTLPPTDLQFDRELVDEDGDGVGDIDRNVLRFSNTIWNAGTGALELRGNPETGRLVQRVYQGNDGYLDRRLPDAAFTFHPQHNHWHFDKFAQYELYREDRGSLKSIGQTGRKTSFCIMDTAIEVSRPGTTPEEAYYDKCRQDIQGMSVGWGDTYASHLYDQWVVLGDQGLHGLKDGKYVLRSVADPKNLLGEGGRNQNSERNNKAVKCFAVVEGEIAPRTC